MELIYSQERSELNLKKDNKVIYKQQGESSALAFVQLEMGKGTNIYHKLSEGKSELVIKESQRIVDTIKKLEQLNG